MGFCFFNNVAVGARHAMTAYGLERVAIVDFDVHHGNGTEDLFAGESQGSCSVRASSTLSTRIPVWISQAPTCRRAAAGGCRQPGVPGGGRGANGYRGSRPSRRS
jgi:hypothetical protein